MSFRVDLSLNRAYEAFPLKATERWRWGVTPATDHYLYQFCGALLLLVAASVDPGL